MVRCAAQEDSSVVSPPVTIVSGVAVECGDSGTNCQLVVGSWTAHIGYLEESPCLYETYYDFIACVCGGIPVFAKYSSLNLTGFVWESVRSISIVQPTNNVVAGLIFFCLSPPRLNLPCRQNKLI